MSRSPTVRLDTSGFRQYMAALVGFDRNVKLFLTSTAFRGMVMASLATVLNLYLYSLGYDARFIGIINAVQSLAILVVSVPLGYVADHMGHRTVLLASGVFYPFSLLGVSLVHSTPLIMIFMFIFGVFGAGYWVAGVPLLVASTRTEERVQALSINSFLLWGFGPLGAFLSGEVVEMAAGVLHISASSTVALRTGMIFLVILALLSSVPYPFLHHRPRAVHETEPALSRGHMARLFAQLLVPDVILAFGIGSILTFGQLYFHLRFHLDPGPIGIIMALGGVISGGLTLLAPVLARHWGNLRSTVRLQWLQVPMMTILALAPSLALGIPAYWLVVSIRGMSDPVYQAFIQERVPSMYRSRIMGLYSVTYSIGFSLGPAASGALQKIGGFTPAFLLGMVCYFIGATLLYLFFSRGSGSAVPDRPILREEPSA